MSITGARLRALRVSAGLKQADVAKRARRSSAWLCTIERAREVAPQEARTIVQAIETLRARNGRAFERAAQQLREQLVSME